MTWGPFVTTLGYAALTGTHMLSMWGMPLFSLVGLWLVYRFWPAVGSLELRRVGQGALLSFVTALLLYGGTVMLPPYFVGHAKTVAFPSVQLAEQVAAIWHQHYEQPLPYVAGARELAARVTVYGKDHPVPYFEWSPNASPWVKVENLRRQGAVFVWDADVLGDQVPADALKAYPELQSPRVVELQWHTRAAIKPVRIGVAVLSPVSNTN